MAWLVLALVVVPTLGRLHQVVHGGALDQAHAGLLAAPSSLPGQPAWDPAPTAQPAAAPGHSLWLPYLLAHHAPVDCLLLDQLALRGPRPRPGIDGLMQRYDGRVPGAAVLVLKDGQPVFRRGYGLAVLEDGTPVSLEELGIEDK